MSPFRHLVGCASLTFGLANLTFWCVPLLLLTFGRLAMPGQIGRLRPATEAIYRLAVGANDWWFRRVLGYRWELPSAGLDPASTYLVIANHQSWADSFLIQSAVVHEGPILKVLVKEELMRLPILAVIFWAYDFPRLKRRAGSEGDEPERRRQDRARIQEACQRLKEAPGAMLVYPEGTRFTAEKHQRGARRYGHLLEPRAGGFATLFEALAGDAAGVLDITVRYPQSTRFWQFLAGAMAEPEVLAELVPASAIDDPVVWLRSRWRAKDAWLGEQAKGVGA